MRVLNFNVIIDLVALLVIGSVWIAGVRKNRLRQEYGRLFNALILVITLVFLSDIPAWLLDGSTFTGARTLLYITNTAYYALQIIYCYLWMMFADLWCLRSLGRMRRRTVWYALPLAVELAVIFANIGTGWIFTFDAANVYARGEYYLINLIPYYTYILGAIAMTVYGLAAVGPGRRRESVSLLIFMFLPVCGTLMETLTYGVSWVWPFTALSLLMVYLEAHRQAMTEERVATAKREQDSRVAIMLSQIQPHFLYNSLTAISRLCDCDPARAKKATVDFSTYLRANLDSLKQQTPVPFETELEHLKIYLELEQMRFGPELTIVYDIAATDFRIPSLTVQPLVENAVKHGVGEREEGGTVTIAAAETDDAFVVTVTDDGVGFDPLVLPPDGRTHIGIDNVRSRLAAQSGGTLDIASEQGVGTKVTIRVPKEAML